MVYGSQEEPLNFDSEQTIGQLRTLIAEKDIKVVFVDTFRAVAGGMKEEKAEEIRKFFNRLKPLKDQGVTLVFLDHCRKPAQFEGKVPKKDQLFASQDKVASAESLIMLKSDERSGEIGIYQKKNRTGIEFEPFSITMKDVMDEKGIAEMVMSYTGKLEEMEIKKLEEAKIFIINALKIEAKLRKELISMGKTNKIGEKNISEALRNLAKESVIICEKEGNQNKYRIELESTELTNE